MLLEAAAQVFHRDGFAATTNRIADRAGVSIGTLYQYFPNKEALLRTLAEHHIAAAEAALREVFDGLRRELPPFDETMHTLVSVTLDLHSEQPGLHGVMHRLAPRAIRDLEALQALEQRIADEVEFHLKRCDRGGVDAAVTAWAIVAAVDAHVHRVMTRAGQNRNAAQLTAVITALAPPPP